MNSIIYQNLTEKGDRYVCKNEHLLEAVNNHCKLSALQILLFDVVVSHWDARKNNGQPSELVVSLDEFQKRMKYYSKRGIIKALEGLEDNKLIIRKAGKGRGKTAYKPNVSFIQELVENYVNTL